MGLFPDAPITLILVRYGERGIISHGVEDGNDFTDHVVTRRSCHLLVVGIRNTIGRFHIVKHELIDSEKDSDGSDS